MNEEMRRFLDGEYDDGMIDLSITCVHCGNELEIEVETIDGLITIEECCSACMRQNLLTYEIKDCEIIRLEISGPDGGF
tara:strand:+ start:231 stop:467 length:237 start_codon:yes stop_codon:yes gene_type:complete